MMWLSIIWGVFATMFLTLGWFHWNKKNKSISHFQLSKRQIPKGVIVEVEIAGTDFVEFADKFNRYIDYYNQTASKQNKAQAIGYWVASATAMFSLVLALVG